MLKIYGADLSTPSNKVRFVANALDLEYEYVRVKIREGEHRQAWFLKLNPVGKIPVIDDDGFILFESNAIAKYLSQKTRSSLYPQDLRERAVVDQWIDFVSIHVNGAMGRIVFNRLFAKFANVEIDERSITDGLNFLKRFLPVVDKQLSQNQYLNGRNFSLADIVLLSTLDPVEVAQVDLSGYPSIVQWRNALRKKEFYTQCHKEYGEALRQMSSK